MTPRWRKFALTAHVSASVGWIGAIAIPAMPWARRSARTWSGVRPVPSSQSSNTTTSSWSYSAPSAGSSMISGAYRPQSSWGPTWGVQPVGARVGHGELVVHRRARGDVALGQGGNTVHGVVDRDAVPVHRGRCGQLVADLGAAGQRGAAGSRARVAARRRSRSSPPARRGRPDPPGRRGPPRRCAGPAPGGLAQPGRSAGNPARSVGRSGCRPRGGGGWGCAAGQYRRAGSGSPAGGEQEPSPAHPGPGAHILHQLSSRVAPLAVLGRSDPGVVGVKRCRQ